MQPTIDESPQPQFSWAKGEAALPDREPRVHFKQCVRVVPIGGPPRAYRVLAANLSRQGMFLKMPTPLDTGTRVALSLEAGGQVLPFAQGEVVWRELDEPKQSGRGAGFGVRFTGFLHPRAHELVGYLVDNLGTGKPLVSPQPKSGWPRRLAWGAAGLVAVIAGAVITSAVLRLVREPSGEPSSSAAEVAVTAVHPAATAPDEVTPPAADEVKPTPVEVQAIEEEAAPMPKEVKPPVAEAMPDVPTPSQTQGEQVAVAVRAAVSARAATPPAAPKVEAPKSEAPKEPRALAIPSGAVKSLSSAVDGKQLTLTLALGAGASITRAFTLANPDRLALDVKGALPKKSYVIAGSGEVTRVRVGRIAGGTRLVVDLSRAPGKPMASGATVTIPLQ